ncbi:CcdB family protein [uncultured Sphingomonas sp.]|uniref:CcdB family protein n=1 Tax=uncultured Sphingomonas sp. TaxID=158754 RepID=UPI0035CB2B10
MARLDVYRINARQCAVDCQSDLLNHLTTRFVVLLVRPDDVPEQIGILHPTIEVAGQQMILATHLAGTVPAKHLRDRIGSLVSHSYVVQRALDTLTSET